MNNLSKKWAANLTASKAKGFESRVRASEDVLSRLAEILTKELATLDGKLDSTENFALPGANERVAHVLGQRKQLKSILKLIEV